MEEILHKIQLYSERKGYKMGYTLIIETDGSGFLTENPYGFHPIEANAFSFESLEELMEELEEE